MAMQEAVSMQDRIKEITPETLDQLWVRAEAIGRVEIDQAIGENAYRVRIRFNRRSGSLVWAEGRHAEIRVAMAMAINEAYSIGG